MPKKDGFADAKKEAEKARQKLNATKLKEAKAAKDADREEEEASTSVPTSGSAKSLASTNGTFAKAAAKAAEVEEEEVAEDYDEDDVVETATTSAPSKGKKESKADLKKQQNARKKDEFTLLAEQESLAKKERIKDRFLRMLIVGYVMDFMKGDSNGTNGNHGSDKKKPPQQKEKKQKKAASDDEGWTMSDIKQKMDLFSGPFLIFVIVAAVLYGKAMEDTYTPFNGEAANFYDIMGIPRDSDIMNVRKKYKSLALTWHPDKNPDCKECPEKFAAISKAYETLSDVEAKKAYDSKRTSKESLGSMSSVDLTAEEFESKVLRSNEVWIVQVYDPNDGNSPGFHPIWEETASKLGQVARFGRIDITKQKKALNFFPQRVVITPVLFRFARGEIVETWMWQGRTEEQGSAPLDRFVLDSFPALEKTPDASELTRWWKRSDRARILVSGKGGVIKHKKFLPVLRQAHLWAEFFSFTTADAKDAETALKEFGVEMPAADKKRGHPWSVVYVPAGETKAHVTISSTDDARELGAKIEEVLQHGMGAEAAHLTVRNHQQLCGTGSAARTFCLFLVDMPDNKQVAKVLEDLATSRSDHAKEIAAEADAEGGGADEERTSEEPFRIQAVRVMTGTSRFPSQPVAVGRDFYTAWAEVNRSPMFLVELETQRVAAVKPAMLNQLNQQIYLEDIKFKELPEGFNLMRTFPDPEVPLVRVLFRKISSPAGAVLAFIMLAAVTAVAPELPVAQLAAAGGVALSLVVLAWPLACRKLLSLLMFGGP